MFSICIPRIFNNIPNSKIIKTFEGLDLGKVKCIDIIMKTGVNNEKIKMAFVHFSEWYNNPAANNLRKKIENPNYEAKVMYDDPWYWILLPNTSSSEKNCLLNLNLNIEEKIDKLENDINCIYQELFKREYIDESIYTPYPNWDDNYDNDTDSLMSISEIENDSDDSDDSAPDPITKYFTNDSNNENDNNSNNDNNSTDSNNSKNDYVHIMNEDDYISTNYKEKLWMTENVCDNC